MATLLEIIKYTIPSLVVFITAYLLLNSFFKSMHEKQRLDLVINNQKIITPIRLQAYERIALLLERISPESLIMRTSKPGMKAKDLQSELLSSIRAEFEHNLSQQVYLSIKAWDVVKGARANLLKLINTAADNVGPDAEALAFSKAILETEMEMEKSPTRIALDFIKQELEQFM
ncbi:MAG: hypothetical protein JXB49_20815 [Bacteroidales bacterium]|nr:hypothetical protein [Bacteroidales bacterium]